MSAALDQEHADVVHAKLRELNEAIAALYAAGLRIELWQTSETDPTFYVAVYREIAPSCEREGRVVS